VKPAHLADAAGVRYQEFSNLSRPLPLIGQTDKINLSDGAAATDWIDGLIINDAEVIISYDHPHFRRFPTVASNGHGQGRITTIGTVPNPALAADLLRWLIPIRDPLVEALPQSVTVHSATNADGERIHVVHNWSWTPAEITLPRDTIDILADGDVPICDLELGPWDVRVLAR
jgi:beta-galactosidase